MNPNLEPTLQDPDPNASRVVTREEIVSDLGALIEINLRYRSKVLMAQDEKEKATLNTHLGASLNMMRITHNALDGDVQPYLEMRTKLGRSLEMEARQQMSNDTVIETKAVEAAPNSNDPLDFESIRDVVSLARRLAIDNFHRQALALAEAPDEATRQVSIELLQEAEKQARTADAAYQSFIAAESANRASLVSMCRPAVAGLTHFAEADSHATASRNHLRSVANGLDEFGAMARLSKGLQSSIARAVGVDRLGSAREHLVESVKSFGDNLRGFADRVRRFGDVIANTPSMLQKMASETAINVSQVAARAVAVIQGTATSAQDKVWALLERSGAKILAAEHKIVDAVKTVRDEVGLHADIAVQTGSKVREAAFSSATFVAGLGGRLMDASVTAVKDGARSVVTAYQDERLVAQIKRVQRNQP